MTDANAREDLVAAARMVAERGLSHGTTGNVSVRCADRILVTPTRSSLAKVAAADLASVDLEGKRIGAGVPSKEAFLHAAIYRARPEAGAVVHTHSLYATALSCLSGLEPEDALPPLTAYYAMRVRALPLVDYCAPGDPRLAELAGRVAEHHPVMLLSNHGPVVSAGSAAQAVEIVEEIEQAARIFLLLRHDRTAPLPDRERERLFARSQSTREELAS